MTNLNIMEQESYKHQLRLLTYNWKRIEWYHYFKLINRLSRFIQEDDQIMSENQLFWLTYNIYLKSHCWISFRNDIINKRKNMCENCGSKWQLTLHHNSYICLGKELDHHVKVLCWDCHQQIKVKKQEDIEFLSSIVKD